MATRNIVPRANGEGGIGTPAKHWGAGHFDNLSLAGEDVADTLSDMDLALAESTGYGIVSGCTPTISGLTVTVANGIVHLAGGTRKEIEATNITLDAADTTNPRIDLVYIDSTGEVAKVTGTAATTPSAPALPANGISVATVSVAANATTGTVTDKRGMLARWYNAGVVNVKDFGAVGDGVTDDTAAFETAIRAAKNCELIVPEGTYYITENLFADNVTVTDFGTYNNIKPLYSVDKKLISTTKQFSIAKDISIDVDKGVEGICYNSDSGKLIIATKNNGDTAQKLLIVNTSTYSIESTYTYTELGHTNSLTYNRYNGKIYAIVDTRHVAIINGSTMAYEDTVDISEMVFCLKFDDKIKMFVGYYQATNSSTIYIRYYDLSLNFVKEYSADIQNFGVMNGMLVHDGVIIMGAYNYLIQCDYFADNFKIIEMRCSYEVEDFCYCENNNNFYATFIPSSRAGICSLAQFRSDKINHQGFFSESTSNIDNINLNYIIEPGVYDVGTTGTASTYNFPDGKSRGFLIVTRSEIYPNVGTGVQIFVAFGSTDWCAIYQRRRLGSPNVGGTWGGWHRVDAFGRRLKSSKTSISFTDGNTNYSYTATADGVFEFRAYNTAFMQVYVPDTANEFILPSAASVKAVSLQLKTGDTVNVASSAAFSGIESYFTENQYVL